MAEFNSKKILLAGLKGKDGTGIPAGGTTGQVLKKKSNTDGDVEWGTGGGGGSAVWGDISGTLADQTDLKTALDAKYTKPASGIPKADLASGVQTSLDKADGALPKTGGTVANLTVTAPVLSIGGGISIQQFVDDGGIEQNMSGYVFGYSEDLDAYYALVFDKDTSQVNLANGRPSGNNFVIEGMKPLSLRDESTNFTNDHVVIWDAIENDFKDGGKTVAELGGGSLYYHNMRVTFEYTLSGTSHQTNVMLLFVDKNPTPITITSIYTRLAAQVSQRVPVSTYFKMSDSTGEVVTVGFYESGSVCEVRYTTGVSMDSCPITSLNEVKDYVKEIT